MTHPTIRDVAALAGVAASTVSVVLNEVDGARVSDPTRQRVREAAELLGYTGNDDTRHLRRGRRPTGNVVLVNDVIATGPYGAALIEGAQAAAWRAGAQLVVLNTAGIAERESEALRATPTRHAHAVVLASLSYAARTVPQVRGLVLANSRPRRGEPVVPHVIPDEAGVGAVAARELIALGHTRIGVATISRADAAAARLRGFRRELTRAAMGSPGGCSVSDRI